MATCHQSLTPQWVGGALPFSHGDCPVRSLVSPARGLDGIPGPPGSGTSSFSPLPEVLRGGFGVPVSHPVLQALDGPSGVHPRHGSCILNNASPQFSSPSIPRRLVSLGLHLPGPSASEGLSPLAMSSLRHHSEFFESSLVPTQTLDYLGMTLATSPLRVFPTLRWVQKLSLLLQEFQSDRLHPVSVWRRLLNLMSSLSAIFPGSRLRMRSLQLHLNASGPLLHEEDLVSWDEGCLRDPRWWSEDSHLLVDLPLDEDLPDLFLYSRRVRPGLGRCSRRSPPLQLMVSPLLELFDQPARVVGHSLCCSGFSALPPGSGRGVVLRQLHSPGLPP